MFLNIFISTLLMFFIITSPIKSSDDITHDAPILLEPKIQVRYTFYDICKGVRNLTDNVIVYIPMQTKELWEGFDSRSDQHENPIVEVTSCE